MIETQRFILRPFEIADLDLISSLYGNPDIMAYMPCGCLTESELPLHLQSVISDWGKTPRINYGMTVGRKLGSKKIGRARIHIDYESDTAMIGWLLIQSE